MDLTIPSSYVLVEVESLLHKNILFKNGGELLIDPSFEPEKHYRVSGIVKAVPESLYFNPTDMEFSMEFDVSMDLKVGDNVFFHYLQMDRAIKEELLIEIDGKQHIYIRYDSCFCAFRGEEVVMLNGWMLLEPYGTEEQIQSDFLDLQLRTRKTKPHPLKGKILHASSPVKTYLWGKHEKDDGIDIEEGDVVSFLPYSNIPPEYGLHESLGKVFYRTQRKELLTKIQLQ